MKKIISLILVLTMLLALPAYAVVDEPASWAEEAVNELKALGQFRGEAFKNYEKSITRGEFIYLAVRMYEVLANEEIEVGEGVSFTDTDDIYALKGATVGITSGIGDNKFGFDQLLTRQQLATFMIRTINLLEIEMNAPSVDKFADNDKIADYAVQAIYSARSNNIISGVGNNLVDPEGEASVQVSMIITNRILQGKNGFSAKRKNGETITVDINKSMEAQVSTPVDGSVSVEDIEGGYEGTELSNDAFDVIGSWVNNDNKRTEDSNLDADLDALDKMFADAGLDVSPTGAFQGQADREDITDMYAKASVGRENGQPTIYIRDWASKAYQLNSPRYVYTMNMVRETIKYYSASNADAEAIYAYINNSVINKQNIGGTEKTFGSTTVKFVDPGTYGINVVFVD